MYRLTLLFLSFLTLATTLLKADEKDYMKAIDEIDESISKQDWEAAENKIIETLRENPSNQMNWMLMSNLGMIQYYQGKDSLAVVTLTEGLRMVPNSITLLQNRARVLNNTGKTNEAVKDYDLIIELDSLNANAYLNRGMIKLYSGDVFEAKKDIDKRLDLLPEDEETWIAAAALNAILDNNREAIIYYNKLIDKYPKPEFYAARAFCLIAIEDFMGASEDIALGLELDNEYSELYLCRAMLNKRRFENDRALNDAQKAINLGANRERVRKILGL